MVPIELAYIVLGIAYKNKPVNTKQAHTLGIYAFETIRHFPKLQNVWPPPHTQIATFIAYLSLHG